MQKIMQFIFGGLGLGLGGVALVPPQTLKILPTSQVEYWCRIDGWDEVVPKRRRKLEGSLVMPEDTIGYQAQVKYWCRIDGWDEVVPKKRWKSSDTSAELEDTIGYQVELSWPVVAKPPSIESSQPQPETNVQAVSSTKSSPLTRMKVMDLADPTFFVPKNHVLFKGNVFNRHHFKRWGAGKEELIGYRVKGAYGLSDRMSVYVGWSPAMSANDFITDNRLRVGLISRLADNVYKVDLYAAMDFARSQRVEDRLINRQYGSIDLDVDGYAKGISFLNLHYHLPDTNWFRMGIRLSQRLQRFAYAAKLELNSARRVDGWYRHKSEYYRDLGNDYYYHSQLSGDGVVQQQGYLNVTLGGLLWWKLSPEWSAELDMSYQFNDDVERRFLGFDAYSHTKYLFIDRETLHYKNNYQLQAALNWSRKNYLVKLRGGYESIGDMKVDDSLNQFAVHLRRPAAYRWGIGMELQAGF